MFGSDVTNPIGDATLSSALRPLRDARADASVLREVMEGRWVIMLKATQLGTDLARPSPG